MNGNQYRVIISNQSEKVGGVLQKMTGNDAVVEQRDFDPTTVLCDLLDCFVYQEVSSYPQDNYSFRKDHWKHPFFLGRKFSGDTKFKPPLCYRSFFVAIHQLEQSIENNRNLSMSEFEILKQFLNLEFSYSIEFREENPMYQRYDLPLPANIKNDYESEFQYVPLQYSYDYDMRSMFEDNNDTPHRFLYSCNKVEDVIFSVLHYLLLFRYKFYLKCNHCGRYFAARTHKQKYCFRGSPYQNFEHLDCEQAVRNIKQKLARRKKSIYTKLSNYADNQSFYDFLDQYDVYKEAVDKCASVESLKRLEQFLYEKK